jgi:uncharacterized hydrophobic protein (TIGR00341 family)
MKKIIITLKKDDTPNITQIIGNIYFYREEIDDRVRFTLIIPDNELDDLISRIRTVLGFVDKETLVEVYSPDFTIFPMFDEKKKREEEAREKKEEKSPVEKLLASVESYKNLDTKILTLAGVASIVGLIGLFLNNVGIIIGAMLIAPMIGPIYSFALHSATGNGIGAARDVFNIFSLILAFFFFSLAVTWIIGFFIPLEVTEEILARTHQSPVYAIMAIFLGFAAIVALAKGIPDTIAGVAVAAALLPPALVSGLSIVLFPAGTISAVIITLQNVFGLMAGAVIATIALRIRPRSYRETRAAYTILVRVATLLLILILLLLVIPLF